jgi:hypothetical protein
LKLLYPIVSFRRAFQATVNSRQRLTGYFAKRQTNVPARTLPAHKKRSQIQLDARPVR